MWVKNRFLRYLVYLFSPLFPTLISKILYRAAFHRRLDFKHPQTLNEKTMWLKLKVYAKDPLVARCADKLRARDYVREKGCGDILNELVAVWERPEQIEWDRLPQAFALKCNFASGFNWICPDRSKLDREACLAQFQHWYRRDFWRFSAELQYRSIPKRILCERYLGEELVDYKIYCFNGRAQYVLCCLARESGHTKFYFFDRDWQFCPITRDGKQAPEGFTLPRPRHLEKMLRDAETLSAPFPFVRVDLYEVEGKVYFGELTFTPAAAMDTGRLPETDRMFGELLQLPTDV